jgi:hypothetical protein
MGLQKKTEKRKMKKESANERKQKYLLLSMTQL